LYWKMCDYSGK